MTEALKVLGQLDCPATTLTTLYTVPGATTTTVSTGTICNRGGAVAKVRLSIAVAGAVDNVKQYVYYDLQIPPNDTFAFTLGLTLAATDVVRAYTDTATVTFQLSGLEVS